MEFKMAKFIKSEFQFHGGYLTYGSDRKFVARFKYRLGVKRSDFQKFLIKNMDVETYFSAYAAGETPLHIVERFGFDWRASIG
jgi:hypothetical protein